MAHYIGFDCVKCGACMETCPVEAISEGYTRCIVDQDKCVDCGACEGVCPTGAIKENDSSDSFSQGGSNLAASSSRGIPFFFEQVNGKSEGIDVVCTEGPYGKWVGRTLTINDDGDTYRYLFYIFPQDESSALLFCPFGESLWLSDLVSKLDKYSINGAANAWPLLIKALNNGVNDNYSHSEAPALIKFGDAPTGEDNAWGVAVKVENIDYEDIDTKYLYSKAVSAAQYALRMLVEFNENDVSTTDMAIATGKETYDTWRTAKTIAKIASVALSIFGMGGLPFDLGNDA